MQHGCLKNLLNCSTRDPDKQSRPLSLSTRRMKCLRCSSGTSPAGLGALLAAPRDLVLKRTWR